ncbi:MAG: ATP-binding protein [Bacteroidales bacterium]|nr:ATP-binding protein [Bacteroidales bacterium]MDT8430381.1 ATP-binding protein [Bacteroidales bacterium]
MNIYEKKQRWKFILLFSAVLIGAGSLFYTNRLVKTIAEDEREKIELWAEATRILANPDPSGNDILFPLQVLENNTNIPVILTDAEGNIMASRNLDTARINQEVYMAKSLEKMKSENDSIVIELGRNKYQYLYYRNSNLLRKIAAFPYFQLAVIILFIGVSYVAFSVSRKAEQNKVWTGLSKETAHQLGTPISSLSGWVEILKQSGADPSATKELEKDSERLVRIADRFSKIGSKPSLVEMDVISVIENSLSYIQTRRGKSVRFTTLLPEGPVIVPVNETLLDWVIENLCKNAMDAMEGAGELTIRCTPADKHVTIDIEDTGKGIPKSRFTTIFKPGYTTKKRGWGLGLSLTKRIIEENHDGKIFVHSSEPGIKTVFRIILNR